MLIDITPYQQKLSWLQEWINDRIDGRISPPMWVDLDAISKFDYSVDQIMKIYQQVGVVFYREKDVIENPAIPISFEQFCIYKQLNHNNQNK